MDYYKGLIPMQHITRLKTQKERLKEAQGDLLKQALLPHAEAGGAMGDAVGRLYVQINRLITPDPGTTEPFVMIRPAQNAAVVDWLEANSKRPMKAMRVWALLFDHLMPHTGQIMLTREEIAEKIGITDQHASTIMNELVKFGAIFTKREKIEGMRGPGVARYWMNPHVAEAGSRKSAEQLAVVPKPGFKLHVIEGGAK